jgi:TolB-like protein/DNA-binding winged helix-turn-helix (wHTH) protein/Flp pilus assembly protein TadD
MDPKTGRKDAETWPNPGMRSFLDFTLDSRRQLLLRGAESIRLRGRTYDVLSYLVMHAGRLVSKRELMESVWGNVAVTDDSLVQCLMEIRRALGDSHDVVKTVRGRGYVFDATVRLVTEDTAQTPEAGRSRSDAGDSLSPGDQGDSSPTRQRRFRTTVVAGSLLAVGIAATVAVLYSGQLTRVFSGGPTKQIRSLAVLPLVNLSGDAEQEYFADGMTDELIGNLMKIRALRVISRTSVMRFKGTRKSVAEIARELDVDAVVEGAVIRSAERVRVTAQVIQANPEKNLWAERYEMPLGDVVILLGKLAREISEAIRIELTLQEQKGFAGVRSVDQETYESFLKGRYYWSKRTEAATQKAIEYFQRAIDRDPHFALAFTGLADSYISLGVAETLQEAMPPTDAFPKARVAVSRALEVDDTLAEAHASLGHIMFQYDRDWSGAEKEFKRAIELNANHANAHHWYALSLMWMGRLDEALNEIRQARASDPLSLVINSNLGFILAAARQYDQGIEQCRRTLEMEPNFAHAHYRLGQIYVLKGKNQDAIVELKKAIALSGGSPRATAELGLAYARLGDTSEASKLLLELRARSRLRYVSPFNMALIYGGLGDNRQALDWLEMAYKERAPSLNFLKLSPAFDSLHSEPRFTELVRRIGLPPL